MNGFLFKKNIYKITLYISVLWNFKKTQKKRDFGPAIGPAHWKKCKRFRMYNFSNEKTDFCWSIEVWAVQKTCKFFRSRQELSQRIFTCKIGVDTAENEPLKVLLIIQPCDLIFTEPLPQNRSEPSLTSNRWAVGCVCFQASN